MARDLAARHPRAAGAEFAAELESPELLALGVACERVARFPGGAYAPVLRKLDRFSTRTFPASLREREGHAARLLEVDRLVATVVDKLRKRGFRSPYLRNLVVARINPVRFHCAKRGETQPPMKLGMALTRMAAAARRFDVDEIRERDLALVAALAPSESGRDPAPRPWCRERGARGPAPRAPVSERVEDSMAEPAMIRRMGPALYELPVGFRPGMRVPVRVFATERLLAEMDEQVFAQAANVATLPGIVEASCCMPDAHWGYGFPIGGVAAMDPRSGVISPGGIGFDINCGMRLVRTRLRIDEVRPRLRELVDTLAERVPAGVGSRGFLRLTRSRFRALLREGAGFAVREGYGTPADLERTESRGCFPGADPDKVSERALERGIEQVGTLGSGNHYLEIQVVRQEGLHDPELARRLGVDEPGQVVVMFHCGSRGFGHQVATDYVQTFLRAMPKRFGIEVPDRELACAPFDSQEGRDYFAAMCCAANMSFANRQVILHRIREVFEKVFGRSAGDLGIETVYDVAHNTARLERIGEGREARQLLVHRKGATRALPPGHPELPEDLRPLGQPVIIGGSMETGSYLLIAAPGSAAAFYSTAHGSGRTMSRHRARKLVKGRDLIRRLEARGILVRAASMRGLAEEAGFAYKNVDAVAEACEIAGLSRRVVHLVPVGNVKG